MNRSLEMADALPTGAATMGPAMADMRAYPRYLLELLTPALGRRILEIGVGHGNYTEWLLDRGDVLGVDIDEPCLAAARERFGSRGLHTARMDLSDPDSISACAWFAPDSVFCINVLEHIQDDTAALCGLAGIVAPGGALALIVPAHQRLYGRMDAEAGHFRRYSRGVVHNLLMQTGWRVESCRYVNALGAAGWWWHNRVRREAGLKDAAVNRQMLAGDRWLPRVARWTDPLLGRVCGLSVAAIGRRTAT
jgi:SAM-dependent methyltransferase